MHDPNSPVTRARRWLAAKLNVQPDPGEGWCMKCALNGGRTTIIPADGLKAHAEKHRDTIVGGTMAIETRQWVLPDE